MDIASTVVPPYSVREPHAAADAEPPDDRQDHVLCVHAGRQPAVDVHAAHLQRIEREALRREHVPNLRRADAECDCTEGAVGRRVAVAARDRHARLRETELGSDHVHDPLVVRVGGPQRDAEVAAIAFERRGHVLRHHVDEGTLLRQRRHDVIDCGKSTTGKRDAPPMPAQIIERLRSRHLMNQMKPDEQLRLSGRQRADRVRAPHFFEQRLGHRESLQ